MKKQNPNLQSVIFSISLYSLFSAELILSTQISESCSRYHTNSNITLVMLEIVSPGAGLDTFAGDKI